MLIDWLLFPLLLLAASAGHGLLIRRLGGGAPSPTLVVPVGFASVTVLCSLAMLTPLHGVAWLAIVVPGLFGWVVAFPELRGRPLPRAADLVAVGVALAVFAVYAAPIVASGAATFGGYSVTVDISHHLDLTSWLMSDGTASPDPTASSQQLVADKLLRSTYPIGFHALLGASSQALGEDAAWLLQPTITFGAPMVALAIFALLGQLGMTGWPRALGAFVAAQPALLYAYSLQAGFKELWAYTMIVLAAAVLGEVVRAGPRAAAVAIVPLLGGLAAFWLTIGPWLAVVAGPPIAWLLYRAVRWAHSRWRLPAVVQFGIGAAVLILTALVVVRFADRVEVPQVVTAQTDLGNLAEPLSQWSIGGIWLTGDHRYPLLDRSDLTHVLIGIALTTALVGLVSTVARRQWQGITLGLALAATALILVPETGPWIDAKVFAIDSGLIVLLAFAGIGELVRRRNTKVMGWVAAALVTVGVLYSNGLVYHSVTLAPEQRLGELEHIGERFAGKGPTLAPYFDEYAEYFLRDMDGQGRVNPTTGYFPITYNEPDIAADEAKASFVMEFPMLVLRRGPDRVRPPAIYSLVHRGRFYDVWERRAPKAAVLSHFPLAPAGARSRKSCTALAEAVAAAPVGARLAWATVPEQVTLAPDSFRHSAGWPPGGVAHGLATRGPGNVELKLQAPASGRYEVWQGGSFGRDLEISVDGRPIGRIGDQANYIGESSFVTSVELERGPHRVRIERGGGDLRPGNGDEALNRYLASTVFVGPGEYTSTLVTTAPSAAGRTCRGEREFAWVELVAPGATQESRLMPVESPVPNRGT